MQAEETERLFKNAIATADFAVVERILMIEKFKIDTEYMLDVAVRFFKHHADDAEHNRLKILTLLLLYAAEFNRFDINSVLNDLILLNNPQLIELALSHPSVNFGPTKESNIKAIYLAASLKDSCALSLLLAKKASPHVLNDNRNSPLMFAAQTGCAENVRILLEHNVDVMTKNENGFCALGFALERDNDDPDKVAILKLLLAHGAAFCIEEPRLAVMAPLMNHYNGCYFFETTMHSQPISSHMENFEEATVFEFTDPDIKIDQTNIPHRALAALCAELLRNNKDLPRVYQLQRCLIFNEKNAYGNVLNLQSLCLQQLMRQQNNFRDLIPLQHPTYNSLKNLIASHQSLADLNICSQRTLQLNDLIEISRDLRSGRRLVTVAILLPSMLILTPIITSLLMNQFDLSDDVRVFIELIMGFGVMPIMLCVAVIISLNLNYGSLRELNAFLQRIRQEDQSGQGLSNEIPFIGRTSELDNFVAYRDTHISHERQLIDTSHHGFFQRVFNSNEPAEVAVEIVQSEDENLGQEDDILLRDLTG